MSAPPENLTSLPWLAAGYRELGVHRFGVSGPGGSYHYTHDSENHALNNPRILEYFRTTTNDTKSESSSWCSAFVNWCMREATIVGTRSAMAKSWLHWSGGVKLDAPEVGAVVVFNRGHSKINNWQGHVAMVWSIKPGGMIEVLGGNQGGHAEDSHHHGGVSSRVSIKGRQTLDALGFYWPRGHELPAAAAKTEKSGSTPDGKGGTMLFLRGLADLGHTFDNRPWPKGALREEPAKEFAKRHNYVPKVLDVAGSRHGANSQQTNMAVAEFRNNKSVTALYGFSAGGYALAWIIPKLTPEDKARLKLVVCLGAPDHDMENRIKGEWKVIYRVNPPEGHMACPNALLSEGI